MQSIETAGDTTSKIVQFPREMRCFDLDALMQVEPDVMLADDLAERYNLEILPFDLIETSERDAMACIAGFDRTDESVFRARLRDMSEQAMSIAIAACRAARIATRRATMLRLAVDGSVSADNRILLEAMAGAAEREAATATLAALTEAHRARGIDAATSLQLAGATHCFPFGLVCLA